MAVNGDVTMSDLSGPPFRALEMPRVPPT